MAAPLPDTREERAIVFPVVGASSLGSGWNDCRDDCTRFHKGTDVLAGKLQPVVSPVDGVVARLLDHPTAGIGVVVRDAAGYEFHLYHLNNDSPLSDDGRAGPEWRLGPGIRVAAPVEAGQLVGFVGDSGNAEQAQPHVHVEIHRPDGTPINPYWSLATARRNGLQCANEDITAEWINVNGIDVSPTGFRPSSPDACAPASPATAPTTAPTVPPTTIVASGPTAATAPPSSPGEASEPAAPTTTTTTEPTTTTTAPATTIAPATTTNADHYGPGPHDPGDHDRRAAIDDRRDHDDRTAQRAGRRRHRTSPRSRRRCAMASTRRSSGLSLPTL
jgi:hypothetical protein